MSGGGRGGSWQGVSSMNGNMWTEEWEEEEEEVGVFSMKLQCCEWRRRILDMSDTIQHRVLHEVTML
jgi:hypothetical protein